MLLAWERTRSWGKVRDSGATERKWVLGEELSLGRLFFSSSFLSKTFLAPLCSSPPPRLLCSPSPSRGNGRLLGRRSKRRNCLRVQSSKKASSIWREGVRRARRSLPCPPAATAAAAAPCRGDPEPRPARVSRRERTLIHARTHTHTHACRSHTRPHAPPAPLRPATSPSGSPLLLPLRPPSCFVCPWVSLCGLCVRRPRAVWLSPRPRRWPPGPGSPFLGAGCTRGESRR